MRAVTGAILILAGVLPLCFGVMLQGANWSSHAEVPAMMQVAAVSALPLASLSSSGGSVPTSRREHLDRYPQNPAEPLAAADGGRDPGLS